MLAAARPRANSLVKTSSNEHEHDHEAVDTPPPCPGPGDGGIEIHDTDSTALTPFDRSWMLGTWRVAWSTLPMWKSKRDVTITYTRRADTTDEMLIMDSDVAYSPLGATSTAISDKSHVRGTERLSAPPTGFTWRGDGWLCFVTSHWWVRGWGECDGVQWMFIYFMKTLFTPQGMDVLLRPSPYLGEECVHKCDKVRDAVVAKVRAVMGAEAETGFVVAL